VSIEKSGEEGREERAALEVAGREARFEFALAALGIVDLLAVEMAKLSGWQKGKGRKKGKKLGERVGA